MRRTLGSTQKTSERFGTTNGDRPLQTRRGEKNFGAIIGENGRIGKFGRRTPERVRTADFQRWNHLSTGKGGRVRQKTENGARTKKRGNGGKWRRGRIEGKWNSGNFESR